MRTYKQRMNANKRYIAQSTQTLIREQELSAKWYAHARKLHEQGESTTYTQQQARLQYINVRKARNALQRHIDTTLFWSYSDVDV